jgi:hypothetical protein
MHGLRLPGLALPALVAAIAMAGCLGPVGTNPSECPVPVSGDVLHPPIWPHGFNHGEPSDLVYFAESTPGRLADLSVNATDGNETHSQPYNVYGDGKPVPIEDLRFTNATGDRHFGAVRVMPEVLEPGLVLNFRFGEPALADGCTVSGGLTTNWSAFPAEGRAAQAGQGAHVLYAGFWENGTLFDTNLQDLDIGSGWPKAGWYQGGHWDPLPVYVYDQDRSEQPAHWKSPFTGTPAAGSPVDEQAGAGYYTTIKGFNEAVKGLPVGSRQVFHLAPEDAYTLPGREDHPLYGDALVFLVEVQEVVDVPCPTPPAVGGGCTRLAQQLPPVLD